MKNNYIVTNESVDPYYNLALEEFLLEEYKEGTIIMLWQNKNTIVIGRHQNAMEEINARHVKEQHINVVRRMTGGGAVYHDLGNLNYSFIADRGVADGDEMQKFAGMIIRALEQCGVKAEFSGRNDIMVEGKKVSGTAQRVCGSRILHHGCLLYDSNLAEVAECLRVKPEKFESKSIKSVRSRVGNIKDFMEIPIELEEFKKILFEIIQEEGKYQVLNLTSEDRKKINDIERNKYKSWEWTYENPMKCMINNCKRYPGGTIEVHLNVKRGSIEECQILGDFMALRSAGDVEDSLVGCRYCYEEVLNVLNKLCLKEYFGTISAEEAACCICCAEE